MENILEEKRWKGKIYSGNGNIEFEIVNGKKFCNDIVDINDIFQIYIYNQNEIIIKNII